jgi:hypothetical protein
MPFAQFPAPSPDVRKQHMLRYVSLYADDELLNLTILNGGRKCGPVASGYYRNREQFYLDALSLNGYGNVHINLHKIHPDLYGRAADRYEPWSKQRYTGAEVIWRPRLCIDLDPVRIPGINSTDDELLAAFDLAPQIADYVETEFGETPLIITSGNGVQMIVKIDEPPESKLPEQFLKHLDERFSNERVEVDTSCHDLPRIVRLPGCLNCKGDDIPERPRRYSLLMERGNGTR